MLALIVVYSTSVPTNKVDRQLFFWSDFDDIGILANGIMSRHGRDAVSVV
jgi:hypothetical protein